MPQADFCRGLHVERHRDGSVRARGRVVDGEPDGYRAWCRVDGTMLRSGSSGRGRQIGQWTTHDRSGASDEVTTEP